MKNYYPLLIIVIISIVLRLYNLDTLPPALHIDEVYIAQQAIGLLDGTVHPFGSYFGLRTSSTLFVSLSFLLGDLSVVTLRLPSVLISIVTVSLLYIFVNNNFSKRVAIFSSLIMSMNHLFLAYSRTGLVNMQSPMLLLMLLITLQNALKKHSLWLIYVAGLITGLGFYSYSAGKILIIIGMITLFFYKKQLNRQLFFGYITAFLITITPMVLFLIFGAQENYDYSVSLLNRDGQFAHAWEHGYIVLAYLINVFLNLFVIIGGYDNSLQYANGPILDIVSTTILGGTVVWLISVLLSNSKYSSMRIVVMLMSQLLVVILAASLTDSAPLSQRILMIVPLLSILIAVGLYQLYLELKRSWSNIAAVTVVSTILCVVLWLNAYTFFVTYTNYYRVSHAWTQPASEIVRFINNQGANASLYIVVDEYIKLDHPSFIFLSNNNKIHSLTSLASMEYVFANNPEAKVIVPNTTQYEVPPKPTFETKYLEKLENEGYTLSYVWDSQCPKCVDFPILIVVTKQ